MKQTAVDWYWEKIKSHFEHDGDLLETASFTFAVAKLKEREQHSLTWDSAIKAHDERGHNHSRSFDDFDEYYDKTYKSSENEPTSILRK